MAAEEEGLGRHFWLWLTGVVIACGVAALVFFAIFGFVWAAWGGLMALIAAFVLIGGAIWATNRWRERHEEAEY